MGKKIYVGNLSYNIGDQELGEVFAQYGNVESARIVIDRESGRSKGFAFVEMSTDDEAKEAIAKLNGTELAGRNMNVSEAKPMAPRENRGGFGGGGGARNNSRGGGFGGGRPRY
jgi:RNA recognition motif-containing protein